MCLSWSALHPSPVAVNRRRFLSVDCFVVGVLHACRPLFVVVTVLWSLRSWWLRESFLLENALRWGATAVARRGHLVVLARDRANALEI